MTFRLLRMFVAVAAAAWFAVGMSYAQSEDGVWFEVETLNEGLGVAPNRIERETPRATVESLLRMERLGDFEAAAHLLDLSEIPPGLQPERGPELARKLSVIIDRKVILDWAQLVDRPDGFDASEPSNVATAGMKRRSLSLWEMSLGPHPVSIRINRIRPAGGDPVWVFSSNTVSEIVPLYNEYGPSEFEEMLPTWSREDAPFGLMWWELIGLPLLVAAALAVGFGVRRVIRRLRYGVDNPVIRGVVKATATPAMIAAVTGVVWFGMSTVFVFSGRLDVVLSPLVAVGFVSATLMLIVNTVEAALDRMTGFDQELDLSSQEYADQRDLATRLTAARRLLVLIVFFVGTGIVLASADVFQSLGFSLLASAGALTIIIGFAARRVLGNILSSMQIALNRSARVGDRVVYKDHLCHVERINFTFIQLRDWDGTRLIVPVEEFVSESFENWTITDPEMLRILKFKLLPTADIERIRKEFEGVIESLDQEQISDPDNAKVRVTGQDVFGIDVWLYVPCADPNTSWDLACEAREKLVAAIRRIETREDQAIFPEVKAAEAA